jgi:DNA polymerase III epsilon subunit-like protein
MENLIFLDLETTGLDVKKYEITQLAAIVVDNKWNELASVEYKIRFEREADPSALELSSYDAQEWEKNGVSSRYALLQFKSFLEKYADVTRYSKTGRPFNTARIAGYNISFDMNFLRAWFSNSNLFCPIDFQALDVLQLALWSGYLKNSHPVNYKLGTVCEYSGVEFPEDKQHDAMVDIRATVELVKRLTYGSVIFA